VVSTEVAHKPAAHPAAADVVPWVLLVVTEQGARDAARKAWEKAGFGVELAFDVEDALDCLSVMTPSLVVVDDRVYRPAGR
jgi:DNA-binding response OmpR family regulator